VETSWGCVQNGGNMSIDPGFNENDMLLSGKENLPPSKSSFNEKIHVVFRTICPFSNRGIFVYIGFI